MTTISNAYEFIESEEDARFVVSPDGSVDEANDAALRLLGVTFEELRAAPRGTFSVRDDPEERDALQEAWADAGVVAAVGETAVRRADGDVIRVRYVLGLREDGRYLLGMRPLDAVPDQPMTMFTSAGDALAAWRAAERRLEVLAPGSLEWESVRAEIASLRDEYRRLFDARREG